MITCEPPPPLALSSLVKAATAHPYRPSGILRALRLADDTRWLLRTAAELVPDHLALIASQPDELARVQTFFNVFEQRYFPLDDYAEDIATGLDDSTGPGNYGETIISYIGERLPVHSLGMDKDGYHQIWDNQRRGLAQVMLFTKPSEYIYGEDGSGLWTAWVEEAHVKGRPEGRPGSPPHRRHGTGAHRPGPTRHPVQEPDSGRSPSPHRRAAYPSWTCGIPSKSSALRSRTAGTSRPSSGSRWPGTSPWRSSTPPTR